MSMAPYPPPPPANGPAHNPGRQPTVLQALGLVLGLAVLLLAGFVAWTGHAVAVEVAMTAVAAGWAGFAIGRRSPTPAPRRR